jgi:hypothetical protein
MHRDDNLSALASLGPVRDPAAIGWPAATPDPGAAAIRVAIPGVRWIMA